MTPHSHGQRSLAPLDASKVKVTPTTATESTKPDFEAIKAGKPLTTFSPHMITVDWDAETGWGVPEIVPYGNLSLSPAAPTFHYASCMFEGHKAYKSQEGHVLLFRPDMNMARMNRSAARLGLPTFDGEQLIQLIRQVIQMDRDWVPSAPGSALYVRPTLIGTTASLAVHTPVHAKLFVITAPVLGSYFAPSKGGKPRGVKLLARDDIARAWTNGTGSYKLGANYGPTFVPDEEANAKGFDQILWIFNNELTEVGSMNFFVVFSLPEGGYEVVTAPLDDGYILPGVTRDSILTLLRDHASGKHPLPGLPPPDKVQVNERKILMDEVLAASKEGRLAEGFGAGTAAIVSPVEQIGYHDQSITLPLGDDGKGPFARVLLKELVDRQHGIQPYPGWSVRV